VFSGRFSASFLEHLRSSLGLDFQLVLGGVELEKSDCFGVLSAAMCGLVFSSFFGLFSARF